MAGDPDRLQELILYIAQKMKRDGHATPSRMKLAKLLFEIDFEAYARRGEPISGSRYKADKLGPAPTDELLATRTLEGDQRFHWEHPFDKMEEPVADDEPRLEAFADWEMDLVNEIIDRYRETTARAMVDEAHKFSGWIHAWDEGHGDGTPVLFEAIFWDESRSATEPWENEHLRELMAARGGPDADDIPF